MILHWLIAFALAFELALGFSMPRGPEGFALFQLHKSVGITILLLTLIRLGWRATHSRPPAVEQGLTHRLANAVHIGFYAFMLLAPLTGWAVVSTSRLSVPTVLYGVVPLPHLPLPGGISEAAEETHEILAWVGIALFVLHVVGAIRHEVLLRRALLVRMAPTRLTGALLGIAVVALFFATGTYVAGNNAQEQNEDTSAEVSEPLVGALPPSAAPADLEETATPTAEPTPEATEEVAAAEPSDAATAPAGPPPVWTIASGGRLGFSVSNGGEAITGSFARWGGKIAFDPENPEKADIRIDIDLSSASVGDATQDGMLKGEEYFDADKASQAVFRASSARKTGANSYSAKGTLRLKGVTRPQAITFRLTGTGIKRHVEGNATIARAPFNIGTGATGGDLAPNVSVNFAFDASGKPQ
ncbi:polyisoprenoid-binding protein [Altererythrobacter sp. B11]|uniref:YceI family protein n=1 Tax=Altererythrobacter sp. B11 TaxID=2060312 RepID=UPI000DC717B8|nr:YceI family protein [Altererythrobacter sp. B11]BBC71800.1 polyisoprenoid-binding protein [Altererythrobacter sp. B11]